MKNKNPDGDLVIVVSLMKYPVYTTGRVCECSECRREAWLSDTTIDAVKENPKKKVRFLCIDCFLPYLKNQKEVNVLPFTEDQKKEIKKYNL